MPAASIDATLVPADDAKIRRLWDQLTRAGLPSRGRHKSPSNRPHVTLCAAPQLPHAAIRYAATLGDDLPVAAPCGGVRFFDDPLIAYLAVQFGPSWHEAIGRLRALAGDPRAGDVWSPHVTLSGRLTDDQLRRLRQLPLDVPAIVTFDAMTQWDPVTRTVTSLA